LYFDGFLNEEYYNFLNNYSEYLSYTTKYDYVNLISKTLMLDKMFNNNDNFCSNNNLSEISLGNYCLDNYYIYGGDFSFTNLTKEYIENKLRSIFESVREKEPSMKYIDESTGNINNISIEQELNNIRNEISNTGTGLNSFDSLHGIYMFFNSLSSLQTTSEYMGTYRNPRINTNTSENRSNIINISNWDSLTNEEKNNLDLEREINYYKDIIFKMKDYIHNKSQDISEGVTAITKQNEDNETTTINNYYNRSIIMNPDNIPLFGDSLENQYCESDDDCFIGLYCNDNNTCSQCYTCIEEGSSCDNNIKCNGGWAYNKNDVTYNIEHYNNLEGSKDTNKYMNTWIGDQFRKDQIVNDEIESLLNDDRCKYLPHEIKSYLMTYNEKLPENIIHDYKNLCDYYKHTNIVDYNNYIKSINKRCSTSDDCDSAKKCVNNYCIDNPCITSEDSIIPPLYSSLTDYQDRFCENNEFIESEEELCPSLIDNVNNQYYNGYYFEYPEQKSVSGVGIVKCKNNYSGNPIIECNNNEWNISGCNENKCSIDNIINNTVCNTEGGCYDLSYVSDNDYIEISNLGEVTCSDGYIGKPIIKCSEDEGVMEFTGCTLEE